MTDVRAVVLTGISPVESVIGQGVRADVKAADFSTRCLNLAFKPKAACRDTHHIGVVGFPCVRGRIHHPRKRAAAARSTYLCGDFRRLDGQRCRQISLCLCSAVYLCRDGICRLRKAAVHGVRQPVDSGLSRNYFCGNRVRSLRDAGRHFVVGVLTGNNFRLDHVALNNQRGADIAHFALVLAFLWAFKLILVVYFLIMRRGNIRFHQPTESAAAGIDAAIGRGSVNRIPYLCGGVERRSVRLIRLIPKTSQLCKHLLCESLCAEGIVDLQDATAIIASRYLRVIVYMDDDFAISVKLRRNIEIAHSRSEVYYIAHVPPP